MPSNKVVIHAIVLPILIALSIIAAITLSQTLHLSLPIPPATPTAAIILPLLTGISIQAAQSLFAHPTPSLSKRRTPPQWLLPATFLFLTIYETVLATLSITQLVPSDALTCQLSERWLGLWKAHDGNAIRRIQDAHQCCGFRTVKNMAWPFDGDQGAGTCRTMYGRDRSCLGAWRRDQQVFAGLVLLVAVGTFAVKIVVLLLYRGRGPWMQQVRRGYAALTTGEDNVDDSNGDAEHHRNQGRIEAPYRDAITSDIGAEDTDTRQQGRDHGRDGMQREDSNMILQPSSMQGQGNEWRD
ncbi:MAG: hypothetical protein Q9184_003228 [Pyrenodesmia sp. 2 TL-2023]